MTLHVPQPDNNGATVTEPKIGDILTDAARERTRALKDYEWQAWHDDIMRRICA